MKILITNDDSHRSPLLELAVRYFSNLGDVSIIVPLHEQSWTGKSVTRFDPVPVHKTELFGCPALSVAGSPADCVNLAVHNLCDEKPDLVVSGINAGYNLGIGFVLSSGTVGACLEANLAGIPAIALSQAFDVTTRDRYIADYLIAEERVEIFNRQATAVLDKVSGVIFSDVLKSKMLSYPITWNINLPFDLTDPSVIRHAPLGMTRYGKCFVEDVERINEAPRIFRHAAVEQVRDEDPNCDSSQIKAGVATLSPIDLWRLTGQARAGDNIVEEVLSALASSGSSSIRVV